MKNLFDLSRHALGVCTAAAIVAACSSSTSQPSLPPDSSAGAASLLLAPSLQNLIGLRRRSFERPINPMKHLPPPGPTIGYISDFAQGWIYVLNVKGEQIGTITGLNGPAGMDTTADQKNLVVANDGGNSVVIYSVKGKPKVLNNGTGPTDATVADHGYVAAANPVTATVTCFAPRAKTPTKTIVGGGFAAVYFLAPDPSGNLFVDGVVNGNVVIGEIVGGCKSGTTISQLTTGNVIGGVGGLRTLTNYNVEIVDSSNLVIDSYGPPSGGSLGNPIVTQLTTAVLPIQENFTKGSHSVLVADAGAHDAALWSFPDGGDPIDVYTFQNAMEPWGAAISVKTIGAVKQVQFNLQN
ncbi:MAG TPA: hypothetical protein VKR56_11225 [Candidatus Cybelea sp.]|nr:hypothetical protein [Candidatus Cybelea sp.]